MKYKESFILEGKISIIIPVYNAEKTIEKCVESILYGEFREIDVILIEDCSRDNSWEKCQSLSTRYENVQCYQNKKNSGVSYSRNHGLSKAEGEYILFVDSDDWVSGRYASTLLAVANKYKDSMIICGMRFYDNITGIKSDYIWDESGEKIHIIQREQFFELQKRFYLQQPVNKIFRREVIEKFSVRFDEKQSMGEDFQFVLDYMEAAKCEQCVVVNEALYYYIRYNNTSLMSRFGLIENENEYKRFEKLLQISGRDNIEVQKQYSEVVEKTKHNHIYFIVRAKGIEKKEKLLMIARIMEDGKASRYYSKQRILMLKEKIVKSIRLVCGVTGKIRGRLQRIKNARVVRQMKRQYKNNNISVISQNCLGGVFYHDMGQGFLSPTINLYFTCPDFVKFVLNLKHYIGLKLQMTWGEEYPIGMLDDIKVYFMHYQTCTEAKEAWERRKQRINWDNILVLSTDMEDFSEETFKQWKKITYPKVLFAAKEWQDESCVYFPQYKECGKVADLIPQREFYRDKFLRGIMNM